MASASASASSLSQETSLRHTPFGYEVFRGLTATPKTLSPWLFYDAEGSNLFEQITELPEYYVTRTERAIFAEHADAIIALAAGEQGHPLTAIELGAGTASKTGLLLEAEVRRSGTVDYYAIDVSESALNEAKEHLEGELSGVRVHTRVADYTEGLGQIDAEQGARKLVLYIGSSIGNFELHDAEALLSDVRSQLAPGDCLLLGADLVKDPELLEAAYDDAAGVTAAFNRNVLARINRELGADFPLERFEHRALWNPTLSRIEMHLVCTSDQRVHIPALDLTLQFAEGETIHTENSYKFTDSTIFELLDGAGFELRREWKDERQWFGVYMAIAR
jgi:dimethylhistidine N-methyltransferase